MAGTMHGRAAVVVAALVVCLASVAAAQPHTSGRVVFQSDSTGSDPYWLGLVNAYNGDVVTVPCTSTIGNTDPDLDAIIASESCLSSALGTTYYSNPLPIASWEVNMYGSQWSDFLCSTGPYDAGMTSLAIINASHPLAGGLAAATYLALSPAGNGLCRYNVAPGANLVAVRTGDSGGSIFAHPRGVPYCGGLPSPGLRTGFPVHYLTPETSYTAEMHTLAEAFIKYIMPRIRSSTVAISTQGVGASTVVNIQVRDAHEDLFTREIDVTITLRSTIGDPEETLWNGLVNGTSDETVTFTTGGSWEIVISAGGMSDYVTAGFDVEPAVAVSSLPAQYLFLGELPSMSLDVAGHDVVTTPMSLTVELYDSFSVLVDDDVVMVSSVDQVYDIPFAGAPCAGCVLRVRTTTPGDALTAPDIPFNVVPGLPVSLNSDTSSVVIDAGSEISFSMTANASSGVPSATSPVVTCVVPDSGTVAGAVFNSTGLAVWFDVADESTWTESGGTLTTWSLKTIGTGAALSPSSNAWPDVSPLRHWRAATFAGGEYMALENGPAIQFEPDTAEFDVFVVVEASGDGAILVHGDTTTASQEYALRLSGGNIHSTTWGVDADAMIGIPTGSFAIVRFGVFRDPGGDYYRTTQVGGTTLSTTVVATGGGTSSPLYIGGIWTGAVVDNPFQGRIGEVLIFGAALPPAHRDEVSQYLAQKWAVTDFSPTNFVYDFGPHTITTAAVHTLVCSFIDHTDAAVSTSISVTVNPGPPSSLSSSGASGATPWDGASDHGTVNSFDACVLDVYGNGLAGESLSLSIVSASLAGATFAAGANTSGVTGVNGCLDFDAVAVDAVGDYVLEVASALPTQSVGLVRVEFLVVGGPISVDENSNLTIYFEGNPLGYAVNVSSACADMVFTVEAPTQFRIDVNAMDYETLTGGVCDVDIAVGPFSQTITITVNNLYEPPYVVGGALPLVTTDTYVYAVEVRDADANTTVTAVMFPSDLPVMDNTTGLALTPATPLLEPPYVIAVSAALDRGTYTDNITFVAEDNVGPTAPATIMLAVDIACPSPDTQMLSPLGRCQCLEAAYIADDGNCRLCEKGTYFADIDGERNCYDCPAHATCEGGRDPPRSQKGWWRVPGAGWEYEACRPADACEAGDVCRDGHNGTRCEDCLPSYYDEEGLCYLCPSSAWIFLVLLVLMMILVIVVLVRVARKSTAYFTSLSVGFNFLQIVAILATFELNWPEFVSKALSLVSLLNFDINLFQTECAFAGGDVPFFFMWMLKLSAPLVFLLIFLVGHAVITCYFYWRRGKDERASPWLRTCRCKPLSRPQLVVLRNASVNAFITILMLLYLMLVSTLLEIFDCPEGEGGVPELRGEPTTECWSPKWWGYFPWSMLAALLYGAGIPIAFWAVLYLNRLNLFKELTIVKFGLMYRRYKVRYFLWELAILFRKLGIVVGVLLVTSGVTRAIIAFLVILISAGAHVRYQPYLSSRVNRLESIHLVCACVVLAAGMVLASLSEASNGVRTFVGVIVIILVVANGLAIGWVVFQEISYQYRLVRRGITGGFASDEVIVNDTFFDYGMRFLEQSRNLQGTTTTLVLSSETYLELAVKLADGFTSEAIGDRAGTVFIQSDGHFHVITCKFTEVGRYTLNIDGFSVDADSIPILGGDDDDDLSVDGGDSISQENPIFDVSSPEDGRLSMQSMASFSAGNRVSLALPGSVATDPIGSLPPTLPGSVGNDMTFNNASLQGTSFLSTPGAAGFLGGAGGGDPLDNDVFAGDAARASLRVSKRYTYNPETGASEMVADLDKMLAEEEARQEAEKQASAKEAAGCCTGGCCSAAKRNLDDVFSLDGERFKHSISFSINCDIRPPMAVTFPRLYTRFVAKRGVVLHPRFKELSRSRNAKHFEVKLAAASAMCVAREPPSRTDPGTALFRRQDGAWIGDVTVPETGGPLFVWALLSADAAEIDASRGVSGMRPSSRALLPNVKCAEFRVLETLGGWEDDLDVEESMMQVLVNADGRAIPMSLLERVDDDLHQAELEAIFTDALGILYQPRQRHLIVNEEVVFHIKLPSATALLVNATEPTNALDGSPLFRDGDKWTVRFTPTEVGPCFVWAQLPNAEDPDRESGGFFELSLKPSYSTFFKAIAYDVVEADSPFLT